MRTLSMLLCLAAHPVWALEPGVPAEKLDLSCWKLTLPVDTDLPGSPDEVRQPELASFVDPDHFFVDPQRRGVVFRAECGGFPTRGSRYPRCELREMEPDGRTAASWSIADAGNRVLTMRAAITNLPLRKRHVVCAQIHDAEDDLLMIRLEGPRLFIERNRLPEVILHPGYALGTSFDLKIEAGDSRVRVWFDEELKLDWGVSRTGCYFKAGCYTQSHPGQGDSPEAFGEVVISRLQIRREKP